MTPRFSRDGDGERDRAIVELDLARREARALELARDAASATAAAALNIVRHYGEKPRKPADRRDDKPSFFSGAHGAVLLTRDVDFFENGLGGVKTDAGTTGGMQTYNGAMTKGDAAEFRYVQSAKATRGPTTVEAWERYQTSLHKTCFKSAQNVGFDRLADNHIGHSENGKALDTFIHAQKASGLPYRIYGPPGKGSPPWFFYGYMPNGWGYQLTGQCTDKSLCPKSPFYDMCTQGVLPDCTAA